MNMPIASVDSTNNGTILCTVRKQSVGTPISGALLTFETEYDAVLCQAGSVETTNEAHANDSLRAMIAQLGTVPHYSGKADTERVSLKVVASFQKARNVIGALQANPPSGSEVRFIDSLELWEREKKYKAIVGTSTSGVAMVSLANLSYGNLATNGSSRGEATHTGVFGQNGSGKTIFALQVLSLRLAQHPNMGAILLDVKGDLQGKPFLGRSTDGSEDHSFDFFRILQAAGREVEVIPLDSLIIDGVPYFKEKLASCIKDITNTKPENAATLADHVVDSLVKEGSSTCSVTDGMVDEIYEKCIQYAAFAWGGTTAKQKIAVLQSDPDRVKRRIRKHISRMLPGPGRRTITSVVDEAFKNNAIYVLDVKAGGDTQSIIAEVVLKIKSKAKQQRMHQDRLANMVVYIDEAARWIPEGSSDKLSDEIKKGLRETRADGVGWFIVSQSMAGLSKDVLRECRSLYFGRNLGVGADRKHLEEALGQEGMRQYERLTSTGRHFFIGRGEDVNLGGGNAIIDLYTLEGDTTAKLIELNKHIFGGAE